VPSVCIWIAKREQVRNIWRWVSHQSAADQVAIIEFNFNLNLDDQKVYPPADSQETSNFLPQMQGFDPQLHTPYPIAPPSYESHESNDVVMQPVAQQSSTENYLKAF
jgi:hypothetical protein